LEAGSKTEFTNNSLKAPKIGKLNIDTLITPQGLLIHEKTQTKKSHATVPLRRQCGRPSIARGAQFSAYILLIIEVKKCSPCNFCGKVF